MFSVIQFKFKIKWLSIPHDDLAIGFSLFGRLGRTEEKTALTCIQFSKWVSATLNLPLIQARPNPTSFGTRTLQFQPMALLFQLHLRWTLNPRATTTGQMLRTTTTPLLKAKSLPFSRSTARVQLTTSSLRSLRRRDLRRTPLRIGSSRGRSRLPPRLST